MSLAYWYMATACKYWISHTDVFVSVKFDSRSEVFMLVADGSAEAVLSDAANFASVCTVRLTDHVTVVSVISCDYMYMV